MIGFRALVYSRAPSPYFHFDQRYHLIHHGLGFTQKRDSSSCSTIAGSLISDYQLQVLFPGMVLHAGRSLLLLLLLFCCCCSSCGPSVGQLNASRARAWFNLQLSLYHGMGAKGNMNAPAGTLSWPTDESSNVIIKKVRISLPCERLVLNGRRAWPW